MISWICPIRMRIRRTIGESIQAPFSKLHINATIGREWWRQECRDSFSFLDEIMHHKLRRPRIVSESLNGSVHDPICDGNGKDGNGLAHRIIF